MAQDKEELEKKTNAEMQKSDDSDMPQPVTKEYKKVLKFTPLFYSLFNEMLNTLPYDTVLKNDEGDTLSIVSLDNIINHNPKPIEINVMNALIGYFKKMPFGKVNRLMSYIVSKEKQSELWAVEEI